MAKSLVYILSTIIWLFASLAYAQPSEIELYVFAPTLDVQTSPGSYQQTVGTLTYGDRVHAATNANDDDKTWINVRGETKAGHVEGYTNAETLLPVPVPDITKSGFASLTDQLTARGEPSGTKTDDTTMLSQTYNHGVTLVTRTFHTPYGEFSEQQISVSGITVPQGFLLARAIVNQDGLTSNHMARTSKIEIDETGNSFIFDDSHWQMISVEQTPDGVTISFPERAD
jgi:hypothetical protein